MQVFPDTWELIARQNPHAVQHPGELAQAIADATATDLPLLPVDAVIAAAALGVLPNALAGLADGAVSRAVFSDSFAESVCALELGKTTACP